MFEKSQYRKLEKELKRLTTGHEEDLAVASRHKRVAVMLIKERSRLVEKIIEIGEQNAALESAVKEESDHAAVLEESLARERNHSAEAESLMRRRAAEHDAEAKQLCQRLARAEAASRDLHAELERLKGEDRRRTSDGLASGDLHHVAGFGQQGASMYHAAHAGDAPALQGVGVQMRQSIAGSHSKMHRSSSPSSVGLSDGSRRPTTGSPHSPDGGSSERGGHRTGAAPNVRLDARMTPNDLTISSTGMQQRNIDRRPSPITDRSPRPMAGGDAAGSNRLSVVMSASNLPRTLSSMGGSAPPRGSAPPPIPPNKPLLVLPPSSLSPRDIASVSSDASALRLQAKLGARMSLEHRNAVALSADAVRLAGTSSSPRLVPLAQPPTSSSHSTTMVTFGAGEARKSAQVCINLK